VLICVKCSGTAYGLIRLFLSNVYTEDAIDMVHSAGTSFTSLYAFTQMRPHKVHTRALPSDLASGRGCVVRMFSISIGYFTADVIKIMLDVLVRNKYPNLWAGRLVHHFIQFGACFPAIFGRGQPPERNLAWRSVLCMAYIAELSSVFLRLSNMTRQSKVSIRLRQAINWALVASFFGSRIVNFAAAIAMFVKARKVLPPHLFQLGAVVQTGGYALSAGWFFKIVQIALKTHQGSVPSIEC